MQHRIVAAALLSALAALPLAAQGNMRGMGRGDETNKVQGTGQLPPGWMVRFDPLNPRFTPPGTPAPTAKDISFVTMGTGYHITSGPAAIYYNPKEMVHGVYSVSATFHQAKSMVHESYGIFIAGHNLQDSTQTYVYMVIRPLDGHLSIEKRSSNAAPTSFVPMRTNEEAAVNKESATDGSATNTLMIHVAADTVHFIVNGKMIKAISKAELGVSTDGQPGIRVNHNISVHIDGWAVKQM